MSDVYQRVVLSQLECENYSSFDLHLFSNESALRKLVSPFFPTIKQITRLLPTFKPLGSVVSDYEAWLRTSLVSGDSITPTLESILMMD